MESTYLKQYIVTRKRCRGAGCLSRVGTYLPALCCRGAGCLNGVKTYLPGTVLQGCSLISSVGTYLPGTGLQRYRLFKQGRNLPAGHCVAGVQAV